jgi:hypothetical protein
VSKQELKEVLRLAKCCEMACGRYQLDPFGRRDDMTFAQDDRFEVWLLQYRDVGDTLLPLRGAGLMDAGAFRVDCDSDWHVFDFEFVDTFHAEIFEG